MKIFLILFFTLVIIYFTTKQEIKHETFVQVQNNNNPNKNTKMIKPIQVSSNYNSPVKSQEHESRDDWITNPKYSPQIKPKIINYSMKPNFETNYKDIRQRSDSSSLIKPIELDAEPPSPNSNNPVEKPYEIGKINSEYLVYSNSENYLSNIARKLLKKAAELSINSTQTNDYITSFEKANYAIGYLDALQDIMTDAEIINLVNIDLDKFRTELYKVQNNNMLNIKTKCPNIIQEQEYLIEVANKL
jgi:hypothetical protein